MRIATWNVNSIKARLPTVLEVLDAINCDVVCLQEIKCLNDQFPYKPLRELGYDVQVVDFGRLPIAEQFGLVASSRVLLGNHGQGMAWSALLPTDRVRCGVVEMFARGAAETPPTDYRDWSAANGAAYVPLLQASTPDCKGRPIRTCGHVVVDVGELTRAVVTLMRGLDAAGPPPQAVGA